MKITKGDYCRFSLEGRIRLLHEFGVLICWIVTGDKLVTVFRLSDFYVEVIFDIAEDKVLKAEPIWSSKMVEFYKSPDLTISCNISQNSKQITDDW